MKSTPAARSTLAWMLFAVMLCAGPATAEEKEKSPASTQGAGAEKSPQQAAPVKSPGKESHVIYTPPPRGGSTGTRMGGGTRGASAAPRIAVLAPDHIGLTTRAQPSLVWYLSEQTRAPVELTVIADNAVEPLAVKRLPSPQRAGIHVEDLAKHGIQLAEGTIYNWYVALVLDPKARDSDVVAGGAIERRAPTPELTAALEAGQPSYRVLAENGIWYDAIADLSAAIAAVPADTPAGRALHAERASLLEQVGVGAAALYDREAGDVPDARP